MVGMTLLREESDRALHGTAVIHLSAEDLVPLWLVIRLRTKWIQLLHSSDQQWAMLMEVIQLQELVLPEMAAQA